MFRRGKRALLAALLLAAFLIVGFFSLKLDTRQVIDQQITKIQDATRRENAAFVVLCRNSDLKGILGSIKSVEEKFNNKFHYPWVFLNDVPFTDEFKAKVTDAVSSNLNFGLVPHEHWSYPEWIDLGKAADTRKWMKEHDVRYGDMESYHHMCRFQSGFFFEHPLLQKYRYYWRVEPDIKILCNLRNDVFATMRQNNYTYGWTVAPKDIPDSIRSLWNVTQEFVKKHPDYLAENNLQEFLTDDGGQTYNTCHFWSNFEIADMDFWRGKKYQDYFNFLDKSGGFFYERWGDAPVHSIAASLFLDRRQIHFFNEIGYFHDPYGHCPTDQGVLELDCDCSDEQGKWGDRKYAWHENSCLRNYLDAKDRVYKDPNTKVSHSN